MKGLTGIALEARLAAAQIEAAATNRREVALGSSQLAAEAQGRGFLLIARKARALDPAPSSRGEQARSRSRARQPAPRA